MSKRRQRPRRDADGDYDPKDVERPSRKRRRKRQKGDRPVFFIRPEPEDGFDSEVDNEAEDYVDYDEDPDGFWDEDDDEYRR